MNNSEKIYTSLCVLFVSLLILGNMVYQKFVYLQLPFYKFELSVGAILYPLTFLITDLITEFYGKDRARFCVRSGLSINILIVILIAFMDYLPATNWSKINNNIFHQVFGFYGFAFVGSVIACYMSQIIDVRLYLLIKNLTNGRFLWLRSNLSTCISLFFDTFIVISFMTICGIFSSEQMLSLIFNSYSWKLFFTICSTPLFYLGVYVIKYFIDINIKK